MAFRGGREGFACARRRRHRHRLTRALSLVRAPTDTWTRTLAPVRGARTRGCDEGDEEAARRPRPPHALHQHCIPALLSLIRPLDRCQRLFEPPRQLPQRLLLMQPRRNPARPDYNRQPGWHIVPHAANAMLRIVWHMRHMLLLRQQLRSDVAECARCCAAICVLAEARHILPLCGAAGTCATANGHMPAKLTCCSSVPS